MSAWISVEDGLPDVNMRVLVFRPEMLNADVGPIAVQWGWMVKQKDVSHWMPLPEPPQSGQTKAKE